MSLSACSHREDHRLMTSHVAAKERVILGCVLGMQDKIESKNLAEVPRAPSVSVTPLAFFCKLQYHSHITKIQSYVSLKLGNVQLAVRLTT